MEMDLLVGPPDVAVRWKTEKQALGPEEAQIKEVSVEVSDASSLCFTDIPSCRRWSGLDGHPATRWLC